VVAPAVAAEEPHAADLQRQGGGGAEGAGNAGNAGNAGEDGVDVQGEEVGKERDVRAGGGRAQEEGGGGQGVSREEGGPRCISAEDIVLALIGRLRVDVARVEAACGRGMLTYADVC
jgi:hypothetical protein